MDTVTPAVRSRIMATVRSKHTRPELAIRKALHRLGYRFRLHVRNLPGCPDIVLPKYHVAIQIRGCFWHGHSCSHLPKSNKRFWRKKIETNVRRDKKNDRALRAMGWSLFIIRECRIKKNIEVEMSRVVKRLHTKEGIK